MLDDTIITVEAIYPINFTELGRKFALSWHYNGSNSFLFVNATKMHQFKVKDSEIKPYTLYSGNISRDLKIDNMKKQQLKGVSSFFC